MEQRRSAPLKQAIVITAFLVAGGTLEGAAPGDLSPAWTSVTTTIVKPERRQEFESHLRRLRAAHQSARTPWLRTWQTFAGNTLEYTVVVPVARFGELDAPPAVARELGAGGWARLSNDLARCAAIQVRQYATPRAELEIDKGNAPLREYWIRTLTTVAPGRMADYLSWLQKDYRPALEKAGVAHFLVSQPVFGAVAGQVVTARMLDSLGEVDAGPILSRTLGDDEVRAINARAVPLVSSAETSIVQLRLDLSWSRPD